MFFDQEKDYAPDGKTAILRRRSKALKWEVFVSPNNFSSAFADQFERMWDDTTLQKKIAQ